MPPACLIALYHQMDSWMLTSNWHWLLLVYRLLRHNAFYPLRCQIHDCGGRVHDDDHAHALHWTCGPCSFRWLTDAAMDEHTALTKGYPSWADLAPFSWALFRDDYSRFFIINLNIRALPHFRSFFVVNPGAYSFILLAFYFLSREPKSFHSLICKSILSRR